MGRVGVYDQIKSVFQDIVAPEIHGLRGEIHALRGEVQGLGTRVDSLRAEMGSMKSELLAEIRRLDTRIDSVDRELRIAIDIRERLAALEARRG